MNALAAAFGLKMDLESGKLPLTRVRERSMKEYLEATEHPIVIRDNHVLSYTIGSVRRVAVCFRSEKQLLSTVKRTRKKDAAFDGLPEVPWQYGALYRDPPGKQYVEVDQDITEHSIEHVSLLASDECEWSG